LSYWKSNTEQFVYSLLYSLITHKIVDFNFNSYVQINHLNYLRANRSNPKGAVKWRFEKNNFRRWKLWKWKLKPIYYNIADTSIVKKILFILNFLLEWNFSLATPTYEHISMLSIYATNAIKPIFSLLSSLRIYLFCIIWYYVDCRYKHNRRPIEYSAENM